MQIEETTTHKYLGDVISNNDKNIKNIKSRKAKTLATTINMNSIASTEILCKIETSEITDKVSFLSQF